MLHQVYVIFHFSGLPKANSLEFQMGNLTQKLHKRFDEGGIHYDVEWKFQVETPENTGESTLKYVNKTSGKEFAIANFKICNNALKASWCSNLARVTTRICHENKQTKGWQVDVYIRHHLLEN